ncbi:hypothetical protein [Nonomuraea ceibae]|uniref:hypothetical protein n=1 Tax=Nonomuraea ceibae TaxID=1935170 RepID=UPI001C5D8D07|nr:hypothetical protein [Nonomuraea ceibae]
MAEIPPYGSREYTIWEQGARAENEARRADWTPAGRRVVEVVEALAQLKGVSEAEIAAYAFIILTSNLPLRRRIRLAWRVVRRP